MVSTFIVTCPDNHEIELIKVSNSIRKVLEDLGICVSSSYPNIAYDKHILDYCYDSTRYMFNKAGVREFVSLLDIDIIDLHPKKLLAVKVLYV